MATMRAITMQREIDDPTQLAPDELEDELKHATSQAMNFQELLDQLLVVHTKEVSRLKRALDEERQRVAMTPIPGEVSHHPSQPAKEKEEPMANILPAPPVEASVSISATALCASRSPKFRSYSRAWSVRQDEPENPRARRLAFKLVKNSYFELASVAIIVLNAIFIGATMEHQMQCAMTSCGDADPEWGQAIEICFIVWFSVELLAKVLAEDVLVFTGEEWLWNIFDLILVVSSLFQVIIQSSLPSLSLTRNVRLLRIPRIMRVIRAVRSCQTLRVMVFCILRSLDVLLWVFLVLFLFMFMFSMIFMSAAAAHLEDGNPAGVLEDDFGTVYLSCVTLFQCISGGRDWGETYDSLNDVGPVFGTVFIFFVYFMSFLVLNVVVGTVVTKTDQVSQQDSEVVVKEELSKLQRDTMDAKRFFSAADEDRSGLLSKDEFVHYLENDKVKAYFRTLDLDIGQAEALFELLDTNGSGEVGIAEFFEGCMRLRGMARSFDIHMAMYQLENIAEGLKNVAERQDAFIDKNSGSQSISARVAQRVQGMIQ